MSTITKATRADNTDTEISPFWRNFHHCTGRCQNYWWKFHQNCNIFVSLSSSWKPAGAHQQWTFLPFPKIYPPPQSQCWYYVVETFVRVHLYAPPPPPPRQTQAKQIEEKKEKLKKYNNTKIRNMYHVSCFVSCYLGYGWGCKNTKYSLWAHSMSNMISLDRSLYIQHGIALCLINSCGTVSPIDVSIALYAVSSFVMYNLQRVHYLSVTPVSVFTGQSHKSHNASDKYPTMRHFVI